MADSSDRYRPRVHRGLRRVGRPLLHELERVFNEFEEPLNRLELSLADIALGTGAPDGFNPESHLAPGVPRIRPVLVLLATRAAGDADGDVSEAIYSAELLHKAVTVHDAALGRQDGRRRRIARRLLGSAAHWLGGHHLTLRALEVARSSPHPGLVGEVLDTMREICEGHAIADDLRRREHQVQDFRDYAEVHNGAVFSFCTRAGAHLAGAPREVVSALGRYGRHMGVAWHALEDQWSLSLTGDEFPRHLARCTATGRPQLHLISAIARDPELDLLVDRVVWGEVGLADELKDRVQAAGGLFAARRLMLEEAMAAQRALVGLEPSPHRDTLLRLARSLASSGGSEQGPGM